MTDSLAWIEKLMADQSRPHFWRKLKLHYDYVLSTSLGILSDTILSLWGFLSVCFGNGIYLCFHRYTYVLLNINLYFNGIMGTISTYHTVKIVVIFFWLYVSFSLSLRRC